VAEEGAEPGSDDLGQERKAVLSAGLGSSALGTTEAVHPDRRMLASRRTRSSGLSIRSGRRGNKPLERHRGTQEE
jgi:hypothetical protein